MIQMGANTVKVAEGGRRRMVEKKIMRLITAGSYGIVKTTLARVVYEYESVKEHFEVRVWVKVEVHEFNLKYVCGILKPAMSMHCFLDDLDEMVRDCLQSQIMLDCIRWNWINEQQFLVAYELLLVQFSGFGIECFSDNKSGCCKPYIQTIISAVTTKR
ncbi:hypothetical protein C2S52_011729 [Perilla frutescens var. hirtella]|nr:hypothetical protein C2S52_011729 [Perilla frutescens var. hirtella]KAH6785640.1 hypothetical protein C2S51_038095 [Perilla frutescens var. frutescens]